MLIIEDVFEVANIIQIAFRKTELDIHYVDSGESALKFLESTIPDIIILDIGMPNMNGWEFLEIIRNNSETAKIPVLILTSYADSTNREIAQEKDIRAFLSKPIDLNQLRGEIDKILYIK